MADIHWLNPVSGDFNTGTNWSGGTVPTRSDNAFIDAAGAPYTVTEDPRNFEQVHSLTVAANATLVVGYYDNFQALYGGANSGAIQVTGGHSDFLIGGTFTNRGTIALGNGELLAQSGSVTTLNGGGQVMMNGGFGSYIGATAGSLDNVDNTIAGGGFISAPIINGAAGLINANGVGSALFISNHPLTNNGLIESTGVGANLFLDIRRGANVDQSGGGTILAANGALVYLEQVTVSGGTLSSVGTGHFDIGNNNTILDGSTSPLVNMATVDVTGGYTTGQYEATLKGAIANSGVINVAGARQTGNQTNLIIDSAGVTLTGAGSINLVPGVPSQHGVGTSAIVGASGGGSVLTNMNNTLTGYGDIGQYGLTLINKAAGVINANAAAALTLDASSTTTNAGLIEATGAGGLVAAGAITNSGTLLAKGGTLAITGALTNLAGSTLNGGVFEADANSTLSFTATTQIVTDNATLILSGATSVIQGSAPLESTLTSIRKAGTLEILGGRNWSSSVGLSNAGALILGGGAFTTASLTNIGRISGFGVLATTLTNTGTITVQSHSTLSLAGGRLTNLSGSTLTGGVYNVATKGVLQLANNVSIVTLSATIDLTGAGATVQSLNTATSTQVSLAATLATIGSGGSLQITGADSFATANTLTNGGMIGLGGGTLSVAGLINSGSVGGTGEVIASGALVNQAGGVIDGAGPGVLTLTATGAVTNAGTLEATGAGGMVVQGVSVAGAGGTIVAGAGSMITLQGSTVTGGTFATAAGGLITLGNGVTATLEGAIANAGMIAVASAGTATSLIFDANTSLTGGGTVSLSANKNNVITGAQSSVVLTNVDNTIAGSGMLGAKKLTLINNAGGVIDADSKTALTIATGAVIITNAGLIEATGKGNGVISSAVANSGTLEANGGTLTLQASVTGAGKVAIAAGTLAITNMTAAEAVAFTGKTGTLELDQSQTFTGAVSGISKGGRTRLDLRDIGFVSPGEATFSGNANSGVLTVSDGTHTARITLTGNYTGATFTAVGDGHGGVNVAAMPTPGAAPPPSGATHAFIAAMAGFGACAANHTLTVESWNGSEHLLTAPRVAVA